MKREPEHPEALDRLLRDALDPRPETVERLARRALEAAPPPRRHRPLRAAPALALVAVLVAAALVLAAALFSSASRPAAGLTVANVGRVVIVESPTGGWLLSGAETPRPPGAPARTLIFYRGDLP